MTDKPHIFQCSICGEVFESDWPEAEAEAEFQAQFPGESKRVSVCDDCYPKAVAWGRANGLLEGGSA